MFTVKECILMKILNCGSADLDLLEDIHYDLDDILDDLMENDCLNINSIFQQVFIQGAIDLKEEFETQKNEIRERIFEALAEEKEEWITSGEMTEEELEECEEHKELINDLELLNSGILNPELDLSYDLNYLDTHVYMSNIDFYRRWMKKEIETIENNMGWEFQ